jgi:hypothetical protein
MAGASIAKHNTAKPRITRIASTVSISFSLLSTHYPSFRGVWHVTNVTFHPTITRFGYTGIGKKEPKLRKVKATCNDLHAGHKLALLNPSTILYEEDENGDMRPYTPALTESQEYLWELYTDHIAESVRFADGCDLLLLVNGDITQGIKHPGHWVSNRISDQITIAVANLVPWFEYAHLKQVRISIGTSAHNFGIGSAEMLVAAQLAAMYPQVDIRVANHGFLTYEGVTFDYAHHGPGAGIRNWLHGNMARFYLRDLMQRDIIAGRVPPRIVERAHAHVKVHEVLETGSYCSDLFVVPSYCMMDDYAVQVTKSIEGLTHGMLLHECDSGRHAWQWLTKTLDVRAREVIGE